MEEDEVGLAMIGSRVTYPEGLALPRIELDQLVESAQTKGWERFLKKECIIPSGRTFLDPSRKGVFFTRQETRNVSAVMVKFADSLYLLPNPFAQIEINDAELETYFN